MRRLLMSIVKALGLVVLVVLVGELVVTVWNRGAFSEPNFYQDDAKLGLRLIPNSSMRLAYLGVEPASEVRINSEGYRGSEFPSPAESDIVVMGDSLSFGLGVGDDEVFAVKLEGLLDDGSHVINYGVPSYGMHEQTLVLEEVLTQRSPRHVIYAISVGRFMGVKPSPLGGKIVADNGWLIPLDNETVQVPLRLPGPVLRWSQLVSIFRQHFRGLEREALARKVIKMRMKHLMSNVARAHQERQEMKAAGWLVLQAPDGSPRSWSNLTPQLRALKAALGGSAIPVSILILPQDVQLNAAVWGKYGLPPQDTAPLQVLVEDLVATGEALGFAIIDPTSALKMISPGATLPRDWHFSAAGHRVIAEVLQEHLQRGALGPPTPSAGREDVHP